MIDLRSDTVTRPSDAMRRAMACAEVGDDVYREDPSVARLECVLAERAGQDAGLFFPSGTQSNLTALLAHCRRGDEYIVAQHAHTYRYEGGGAAALGGIQPQPLDGDQHGGIDLTKVENAIKADDIHFAKTRLLALENTSGGRVLPLAYLSRAAQLTRARQLGFHLDGARAFNAAIELGVELTAITAQFDSVSICLSKGLGAPVGSVLVADNAFIRDARRWRKVVGGGMRQAGMLAAAGLYALEHNITRLADDHARAQMLAEKLSTNTPLEVIDATAHTNMLFVTLPDESQGDLQALCAHAKQHGVLLGSSDTGKVLRLVTHLDVTDQHINDAATVIARFFE